MKASHFNLNIDYKRPVKVADDVYWIGFSDKVASLHCNPYLIVDGDEAVVIDGGSRPDFPTVMMKILQSGVEPSSIKALIYHHYDPDLVGSISNFEDIISSDSLKVISDSANNMFIRHYSMTSQLYSLESMRFQYKFSSGRELQFFKTPYCHAPGSFVTFDTKSKILFSSDLFGSYDVNWELFFNLEQECKDCTDFYNCINKRSKCPTLGILNFHKHIMTSTKALKHTINIIRDIPAEIIAPQHGSIITQKEDIVYLCDLLYSMNDVGIDGVIKD